MESSHHVTLTEDEVDELLEPIHDHGHCWGFLAQEIIKNEMERRRKSAELLVGLYGDWPADGH